jgi:hypothetical protein
MSGGKSCGLSKAAGNSIALPHLADRGPPPDTVVIRCKSSPEGRSRSPADGGQAATACRGGCAESNRHDVL